MMKLLLIAALLLSFVVVGESFYYKDADAEDNTEVVDDNVEWIKKGE